MMCFVFASEHLHTRLIFVDDSICASFGGCHAYATCFNDNGKYSCRCNIGYTGNGTICTGN